MPTVDVLDDNAPGTVSGAVDHGMQIDADVLDRRHRGVEQVHLDATKFIDPAARAILVTNAHRHTLDAITVTREREPDPAPHMVRQGRRERETLSLDIDIHLGCLSVLAEVAMCGIYGLRELLKIRLFNDDNTEKLDLSMCMPTNRTRAP